MSTFVIGPPRPKCVTHSPWHAWFVQKNGSRHIRTTCVVCGRWLGWEPQTHFAVLMADIGTRVMADLMAARENAKN